MVKMVEIQVENKVFVVQQDFFDAILPASVLSSPHSSISASLNKHVGGGVSSPGLRTTCYTQLPGVTASQFERLLSIYYESHAATYRLGLSTVYDRSMKELAGPSSFEEAIAFVALSKMADVPSAALLPAIRLIASRTEPLTEEEYGQLGFGFAVRIADIREKRVEGRFASEYELSKYIMDKLE